MIALFRSYPTTLAMNIPFQSLSVSANESLKMLNVFGENSAVGFFAAGFISGGFAGFCTTPLDVIRTRLNTQNLKLDSSPKQVNVSRLRRPPITTLFSAPRRAPVVHGFQHARPKYTSPLRCPFLGWASPSPFTSTPAWISPRRPPPTTAAAELLFTGPWQAMTHIYLREGWVGFFRGAKQRVGVQAPGFAISWTAYETFKRLLVDTQLL